MVEGAKIEVQKFFIGRTTLFGLYFGVIFGIIFAIIGYLVLTFVSFPEAFVSFMEETIGADFNIVLTSAIFLFFVIVGLFGAFFGTIVYNLVAKMHGKIQFFLMELEDDKQVPQMQTI